MLTVDPTGSDSYQQESYQMDEPEEIPQSDDHHFDEEFVLDEYMNLLRGFHDDGEANTAGTTNSMGIKLSEIEKEASTMIFDGATSSRLSIIFLFLSIQAQNRISNVAMDAIFKAISEKIIPVEFNSKMPTTRAEARKIISHVGLDYTVYHSCPCDQTLYYGPLKKDLKFCPHCKLSRYQETTQSKTVPRKVCNH